LTGAKTFPAGDGQAMMQRFLEKQLELLPLPLLRESWLRRRKSLHREILAMVGIDDLIPAKWNLNLQPNGRCNATAIGLLYRTRQLAEAR
jgi:hypothetical protein